MVKNSNNREARTQSAESTAVVIGAAGGLGEALFARLQQHSGYSRVLAVSRTAPADGEDCWYQADTTDARQLSAAAAKIGREHSRIHLLINCTGTLQDGGVLKPEKSLRELESAALLRLIHVNAFAPLAALRAFTGLLRHEQGSIAVVLSAMVGSISDNRLGGWYSYRMSKAALNMGLRTAAVEMGRLADGPVVVALHPGTTATPLSQPFLRGREYRDAGTSAVHILDVVDKLKPEDNGRFFNWDGRELAW